jgi:tetratricopeptide (TPR) repeat protein
MYARRPDEALACYAQAIEVDPNYVLAHRVTGLTLVRARRFDEGLAALRRATALAPDSIRVAADLGYALGVAGQIDSARTVLAEVREIARRRQVSAYDFAVLHAGLGESEAALDWLEKAYADRATGLRWLKVESIFDGLRGERRFADLLRRLAIPD